MIIHCKVYLQLLDRTLYIDLIAEGDKVVCLERFNLEFHVLPSIKETKSLNKFYQRHVKQIRCI